MSHAPSSTACIVRSYSGAPTYAEEGDANDEGDDYLQAYEELLLHATSHDGALSGDSSTEGVPHLCEESRAHGGDAVPLCETAASDLPPADALVEETLAVLPTDGTTVLLTDLTRSLDVEAISELFGSVRSFVELYPHCFACTQDAQTGRWHVARARSSTPPLSPVVAAATPVPGHRSAAQECAQDDEKATIIGLDVAAMMLGEELTHVCGTHSPPKTRTLQGGSVFSAAKRSRRRLTPVVVPRPLTSSSDADPIHNGAPPTTEHAWWSTIASLLPEDGTPLPISVLRVSLPESVAQGLRATRVGLARSFKENYATSSRYVALTADATALARAAALRAGGTPVVPPLAFWSPGPQDAAVIHCTESSVEAFLSAAPDVENDVYVHPPVDYDASQDAEPWMVTLSLDEGEVADPEGQFSAAGDVCEGALLPSADHAAALEASTGLQEVLYSGLNGASGKVVKQGSGAGLQPHDLDLERLRDAPSPPTAAVKNAASTATQLPASAGTVRKVRPPRPSTPAEWLALHTAMAEARGWITPMQMLDYLVECVPTFFIPVEELLPSDAILKLVGACTSMRTLVCRIYMYFVERSEDKVQVRLSPTVEHPQRGMANVHYAAWSPELRTESQKRGAEEKTSKVSATYLEADGSASTAAEPVDCQGSLAGSGLRSSRAVLQCSDVTKAFPVMRVRKPIKSLLCVNSVKVRSGTAQAAVPTVALPSTTRLGRPGGAAGSRGAVVTSSAPAILQHDGDIIALSSVSTAEIGYPFLALATQPAETWPWWARLLCVLPFDTYVPLDHLCVYYCPDLSPDNLHLAWRATDASLLPTTSGDKNRTPIPLSLLRAPTTPRKVRLRPFWLSPGCTAELESAVMPSGLLRQLRPTWLPVSRVLARLTPDEREASFALAVRRPSAASLSAEEALVTLLRDCGQCCWVQEDGARVRKYAASSALDDHFHLSLSLLHGFSSARTLEPLQVVLNRASEHVSVLFAHARTPPQASPDTVGLIGMLRQAPPEMLKAFLTRHSQWLEVMPTTSTETGDTAAAAAQLLVRRRASLVSF
ncbi:hypothetical protein JKF63_06629 [Porcisia hertigi]|uniref:Uncharacterized protein n=1 Tax=Porcisia hertigi TaxID=2761500 RepID=A0A836LGA5_9TRYP|nr:hypothetical protein JKF63_06629 [Porcisia hertigi]